VYSGHFTANSLTNVTAKELPHIWVSQTNRRTCCKQRWTRSVINLRRSNYTVSQKSPTM